MKGFPGGSGDTAGDTGSILGLGRSPGGGNGNLLQCSCLGNPMDRRAWRATVHGVTKSQTWLLVIKHICTSPWNQLPFFKDLISNHQSCFSSKFNISSSLSIPKVTSRFSHLHHFIFPGHFSCGYYNGWYPSSNHTLSLTCSSLKLPLPNKARAPQVSQEPTGKKKMHPHRGNVCFSGSMYRPTKKSDEDRQPGQRGF